MKNTTGIKHLIECHCILPQYKKKKPAVYHKFTVYSKFDSQTGKLEEKIVQCNNCNALHSVIDVCRSEIVTGKDEYSSGLTIEDMSFQLDEKLSNLLTVNNCDYATWEHVLDIIENENWDDQVVIKRDVINDKQHVKILKLSSETKIKIISKIINDEIIGDGRL